MAGAEEQAAPTIDRLKGLQICGVKAPVGRLDHFYCDGCPGPLLIFRANMLFAIKKRLFGEIPIKNLYPNYLNDLILAIQCDSFEGTRNAVRYCF
jgi:hypothetical protein